MKRFQMFFSECFSMVLIVLVFFSFISACHMQKVKKEIDVTSKTTYSGIVNDHQLEIDVVATFNTERGGVSTCNFKKLPPKFNPATLGTHA